MVCDETLRALRLKIAKHRGSGAPDRTAQLPLEDWIKARYFYSFLSGSAAIWYQNSLRRFSYIYETILYEFWKISSDITEFVRYSVDGGPLIKQASTPLNPWTLPEDGLDLHLVAWYSISNKIAKKDASSER